jgi:hypothetical protein
LSAEPRQVAFAHEYQDLDIRSVALQNAISALRPVPVTVNQQGTGYQGAYSLTLPDASKIIQTATVFEAYLRNGSIQ